MTKAWDEMVDGRGGIRPHWRSILGTISGLVGPEMHARALRLERAAEDEAPAPSWRCDPLPLALTAAEFQSLQAGLAQRAQLLEAILADLYGTQSLLAGGALPPALLFQNPGFLRACRAGPARPQPFLQTYAADLLRAPSGEWLVLADRTGGAPGIGYARESRTLLARVMPELFRTTQVRQLRPFFEAWQDTLLRMAPPRPDRAPLVVLLTPGVGDPNWPEHLALSRDLACGLVQARDLTVRGGVLYLKTLQGLQPVDVLLRRVPGASLDPLELSVSAGSGAGVTGLLDAARHGGVHLLNHPGAAVIEAPAFAAFLPDLARRLLGAPPILASVPALWLGAPGAMHALQDGTAWSIRPALDPAPAPVPLASLSPQTLAELAGSPAGHVACAPILASLAPCQGAQGLDARPLILRLFLMHDGAGWRMMPGGVARIVQPGEHITDAVPPEALFKDVWVLSQESLDIVGPEPVAQARVPLRRGPGDMPSRVADDFFWLGRYVERLDAQARIGRAGLLRRSRGAPLPREIAELEVLSRCLSAAGLLEADEGNTMEAAIRASLLPGGHAAAGLDQIGRLSASLRDRLTVETHATLVHAIRTARTDGQEGLHRGVDGLVHAMMGLQRLATMVAGLTSESMVVGGGRLFLDLGRRVERSLVTAWTLATILDQPASRIDSALRMMLEVCDSAITYRSRYLAVLQPAPVLDLVLADTGNPRALGFQFAQTAALLDTAEDPGLARAARDLQARVGALVERVLHAVDPGIEAAGLPHALFGVAAETASLSDRITRRFFALLPAAQAVGLEIA